ncbi:MAG: flagellar assembly peptidoglycan hydrolase FlgJ [Candidatus Accumulibacter sp.]|jgi:flagellar protein FlgJ|nr:flagellar assembly peptidoglycan hydrolase FlgJ [Accumulibacter sp.]
MKTESLHSHRFVLDTRTASDLRRTIRNDPQTGLKEAAGQFEALLLQTMLKSMRDATPQDGPLDNDQTRFFTSILDQQLALNLSAVNALGFGQLIERQMGSGISPDGGEAIDKALGQLRQALFDRQAASSAGFIAGGAGRPATLASDVPGSGREYVDRVWPHAVEAARTLGVPPHFLVAHSALESGWGKSEIRLPDGSPSYNVFGVKAGAGWQGPAVEVATTEYENGAPRSSREKFRVYASYGEAFRDYAGLLADNSRYAQVQGEQDGARFARSLQQAGYATDPEYADKLARVIGGTTLRTALAGRTV